MDLVYTIVLPLISIVVFGLLGLLRGARREAYVSGAIALSVLMSLQWGQLWGDDLSTMVSGLGVGSASFYVVAAIMALTVLVIGYGLGSSVVKGAPTGTSRTLGLLLGILNGGAFAGWLLRFGFQFLDGSNANSIIYKNDFDQALMIWAGWYPVALAAIGAVVALVRAFKGDDEVEVTRTTSTTAAAATPAVMMPPPTPTAGGYSGYGAGASAPTPNNTGAYGSGGYNAPTVAYTPPPASYAPPPTSYAPPTVPAQESSTFRPYEPPRETPVTEVPKEVESETKAMDTPLSEADITGVTTVIPTGEAQYHTPPLGMPAAKVCKQCGHALEPGQVFCVECGTRAE